MLVVDVVEVFGLQVEERNLEFEFELAADDGDVEIRVARELLQKIRVGRQRDGEFHARGIEIKYYNWGKSRCATR